ncbi:MAG: hypothetical protein AAGC54_09565 [Cyanobacteria bacterium P01_F01_bin.4]
MPHPTSLPVTTHHPLPFAFRPAPFALPTTHHPLPTTHHPLPITHYRSAERSRRPLPIKSHVVKPNLP